MATTDEDPAAIFDRYHVEDFVQINDGMSLHRQQLIDHAGPVRRNVASCSVDVHKVVVKDELAAAHYTLHAVMRKGGAVTTEIYAFAAFAPDGRLQHIHQITRSLT
ncbi:nuclear transport factor 2 family protein [Yinghuangia aomiensis]